MSAQAPDGSAARARVSSIKFYTYILHKRRAFCKAVLAFRANFAHIHEVCTDFEPLFVCIMRIFVRYSRTSARKYGKYTRDELSYGLEERHYCIPKRHGFLLELPHVGKLVLYGAHLVGEGVGVELFKTAAELN